MLNYRYLNKQNTGHRNVAQNGLCFVHTLSMVSQRRHTKKRYNFS